MKSYAEAQEEFNNLLSDDPDFIAQWKHEKEEDQQKAFFEWCSLYEDTKHIKNEE